MKNTIHVLVWLVCFCCFFSPFTFISWRLITLQYCSGSCHTLTWISHGFTCVPLPDPPSHLPLHPIPLGLPSVPALSICLKIISRKTESMNSWSGLLVLWIISYFSYIFFWQRLVICSSFLGSLLYDFFCRSFEFGHVHAWTQQPYAQNTV